MGWRIYFDESICEEKFILAAVIFNDETDAEADAIAEWNELVSLIPEVRGKVFKASEIMRHEAEIELFNKFYQVIEKADCITCVVAFDVADHKSAVEAISWPMARLKDRRRFKTFVRNPYVYAFKQSLVGILSKRDELGISGSLIPVFDERTEAKLLLSLWSKLDDWYSSHVSGFDCSKPVFASDESYPALQMADMFAWLVRKWEQRGELAWVRTEEPILDPLLAGSKLPRGLIHRFSKEDLENEYNSFLDAIVDDIEKVDAAANWGVEVVLTQGYRDCSMRSDD